VFNNNVRHLGVPIMSYYMCEPYYTKYQVTR